MTKKIYLAARWQLRDRIRLYAEELKQLGFEITARWLYDHKGKSRRDSVLEDIEDVLGSNILINFTEHPTVGYNTGGRHVEFGLVLACNYIVGKKYSIQTILVGPKENIFHELVDVELNSFTDLTHYLRETYLIEV